MIRFYWGPTRSVKLAFPALMRTWAISLYGVSVFDVFVGVMVRGQREVTHDHHD